MKRAQIRAICTAYEVGMGAALRGIKISDNPYPRGCDLAKAWDVGRREGMQLGQCAPQVEQADTKTMPLPLDEGGDQ
jgi:hypothetical protein